MQGRRMVSMILSLNCQMSELMYRRIDLAII